MASKRDKLISSAQKHVRKGNWDKAIRDYRQVLEKDPSDVRTMLKVADLHVKIGEFEEALVAYQTVAYTYANDDIYDKAVAVYKQALRVAPDNPRLHRDLGEAYYRHGRLKDALRSFHKAQKLFRGENDTINHRDVLERMVAIDPEDIGLSIQLAERYEKDGLRDEAIDRFRECSEKLYEEGRLDEFIQVGERIVYLSPDETTLRKQIVRLYHQRSDDKHALKHLQILFKERPDDVETLELLAQTFARLGNRDKAVLVYLELARAYFKNGYEQRTLDTYKKILELDPNQPEARQALGAQAEPVEEVVDAEPEPEEDDSDALEGIEFLDESEVEETAGVGFMDDLAEDLGGMDSHAIHRIGDDPGTGIGAQKTSADDEEELEDAEVIEEADPTMDEVAQTSTEINQVLTEVEVFLKYNLFDRAEGVLTKLISQAPHNIGVREHMFQYYQLRHEAEAAGQELFELARITRSTPGRAVEYLRRSLAYLPEDDVRAYASNLGLSLDFQPEDERIEEISEAFIGEVSEGIEEISDALDIQADAAPSVVEFLPPEDDDEDDDVLDMDEVLEMEDILEMGDDILEMDDDILEMDDEEIELDLDDDILDFEDAEDLVELIEEESEVIEISVDDDELLVLDDDELVESSDAEEMVMPPDVDDILGDDMDLLAGLDGIEGLDDISAVSDLEEIDELSLEGAEEMELDLDDVSFNEADLSLLDAPVDEENFEFDLSSDDADRMFDELFGGFGEDEADDALGMLGGGAFDDEETDLNQIDHFIERGMFSEAEDALDRFVEDNPGHEGIAERATKIAQGIAASVSDGGFGERSLSGQFSSSLSQLSEQISAVEVVNTNLELGNNYRETGLFNEAIDEYKQALDDPDASGHAQLYIGICELERGDIEAAESAFNALLDDENAPQVLKDAANEKLSELQAQESVGS